METTKSHERHPLTNLSLGSLVISWDIGKQNSPRSESDAAECGVPSVAILFAYIEIIHQKIQQNLKITPDAPKNESGLTLMIMMGESIH